MSLVKKDAGLLDAFGKGASDDIQTAKTELYRQMTTDPSQPEGSSEAAAPLMSPPPSPKPRGASDTGAAAASPEAACVTGMEGAQTWQSLCCVPVMQLRDQPKLQLA